MYPGLPTTKVNYADFSSPSGFGHYFNELYENNAENAENDIKELAKIAEYHNRLEHITVDRQFYYFIFEIYQPELFDPSSVFFNSFIRPHLFYSSPYLELSHYLDILSTSDKPYPYVYDCLCALEPITVRLRTITWSVHKLCNLIAIICAENSQVNLKELIDNLKKKEYFKLVSEKIWDLVVELYDPQSENNMDESKFIQYYTDPQTRDLIFADADDFEVIQEIIDLLMRLSLDQWDTFLAIPGLASRIDLTAIASYERLDDYLLEASSQMPDKLLELFKRFPQFKTYYDLSDNQKKNYVDYLTGEDRAVDQSLIRKFSDKDKPLTKNHAQMKVSILRETALQGKLHFDANFYSDEWNQPETMQLMFISKEPFREVINLIRQNLPDKSQRLPLLSSQGLLLRLETVRWSALKLYQLFQRIFTPVESIRKLSCFKRIDEQVWNAAVDLLNLYPVHTEIAMRFSDGISGSLYLQDGHDFLDYETLISVFKVLPLSMIEKFLKLPDMSLWTGLSYQDQEFVISNLNLFISFETHLFKRMTPHEYHLYSDTIKKTPSFSKALVVHECHGYIKVINLIQDLDQTPLNLWNDTLLKHDTLLRTFTAVKIDEKTVNLLLNSFNNKEHGELFFGQPLIFEPILAKLPIDTAWSLIANNPIFGAVFIKRVTTGYTEKLYQTLEVKIRFTGNFDKKILSSVKAKIEEGLKLRAQLPATSYYHSIKPDHTFIAQLDVHLRTNTEGWNRQQMYAPFL